MNKEFKTHDEFRFLDPVEALRYISSKRAVFTLVSTKTGKHYTYKNYQFKTTPFDTYVKTRVGPFFTDIAVMWAKKFAPINQRSKVTRNYKAFAWILKHLLNDVMPPDTEIYHHGRCCNCGRILTHPYSIKRGIGPECYKKLGIQGGM